MRRQSREIALQILFQTEYAPQISYEDLFSIHESQGDRSLIKYADEVVRGVHDHKVLIDEKIGAPIQSPVCDVDVFFQLQGKQGVSLAIDLAVEYVLKNNHYTNLQPLCSKVNRDIKKNKLII